MRKELQILGIISIALSVWKLYETTEKFLHGPAIYKPGILYLVMLPRYYFFITEWLCFSSLFLAGITLFIYRRMSFYLYNFFMICFVISWYKVLSPDIWDSFSIDNIPNGILFILSTIELYIFRKPHVVKSFESPRAVTTLQYILMIMVFFTITELPGVF